MQTPLMELIDWINNLDNWNYSTQNDIIAKATELLEKEREVITWAFDDGYYSGSNKYTSVISDNGKNYYKQTFTDESK